jgi:hypothetical protein
VLRHISLRFVVYDEMSCFVTNERCRKYKVHSMDYTVSMFNSIIMYLQCFILVCISNVLLLLSYHFIKVVTHYEWRNLIVPETGFLIL